MMDNTSQLKTYNFIIISIKVLIYVIKSYYSHYILSFNIHGSHLEAKFLCKFYLQLFILKDNIQ